MFFPSRFRIFPFPRHYCRLMSRKGQLKALFSFLVHVYNFILNNHIGNEADILYKGNSQNSIAAWRNIIEIGGWGGVAQY